MADRTLALTLSGVSAAAVVGILHRLSDGAILSSRSATLVSFALALAPLAWIAWHTTARSPAARRPDRIWLLFAFGACLLTLATYWGREISTPGDYNTHRMYTYQLLNGYAEGHEPYRDMPGHYPFLVHAILATLVHATGLTVHYAMLLLALATQAGIARFAVLAGRGAGLQRRGAAFFAGLLLLYGGFWVVEMREFMLFAPAVQLAMPFFARNFSLLLVLMAASLAFDARDGRMKERSAWLAGGLLVGLLGLTRPFEFGLAALLLFGGVVRRRSREGIAALVLAGGIAAFFYVPLVLYWLELGIGATKELARPADFPTSPFLYLPLVPFILAGALRFRQAPMPIRACWSAMVGLAGLATIAVLGDALGLAERFALAGGLGKLERVGQLVALLVFAVSAYGFDAARRGGRGLWVAAVACVLLGTGFVTVLRTTSLWLYNRTALPPSPEATAQKKRWTRPPEYVFDLAGSPLYLRHLLENPLAIVMAPPAFSHNIARRNGVDVVYAARRAPIWRDTAAWDVPDRTRKGQSSAFYRAVGQGRVAFGILENFNATYFLAPAGKLEGVEGIEELGELGLYRKHEWVLFRVSD